MEDNKETEKKYPIGGFAPGNYLNKCRSCGIRFAGDKRANQCEPCAIKEMEQDFPLDEKETTLDGSNKYWEKNRFLYSANFGETAVCLQVSDYALHDSFKANYDKLVTLEANIQHSRDLKRHFIRFAVEEIVVNTLINEIESYESEYNQLRKELGI
jgi:hypothetical protein